MIAHNAAGGNDDNNDDEDADYDSNLSWSQLLGFLKDDHFADRAVAQPENCDHCNGHKARTSNAHLLVAFSYKCTLRQAHKFRQTDMHTHARTHTETHTHAHTYAPTCNELVSSSRNRPVFTSSIFFPVAQNQSVQSLVFSQNSWNKMNDQCDNVTECVRVKKRQKFFSEWFNVFKFGYQLRSIHWHCLRDRILLQ